MSAELTKLEETIRVSVLFSLHDLITPQKRIAMAEKSHASDSKPVLDKETMHMLDPWLKKEHKGSLAHRVAELFKHPSVLLVLDVLETTDHINDILEVIDIPMLMGT